MGLTASIVIPNYNYARFIGQCIDSTLAQTVAGQVVVADNCSTDGSQDIIRSYGDAVVAVLRTENGGQAASLNTGISSATGDVVMFVDSDDWIEPQRVERVLAEFAEDDAVMAVRNGVTMVDVDGHPLADQPAALDPGLDPGRELLLYGDYAASTGTIAVRRPLLDDLFPIPEPSHRTSGDVYLKLGAALTGRMVTIADRLTVRRCHDEQLTTRWRTDPDALDALLAQRYQRACDAVVLGERFGQADEMAQSAAWWRLKAEYEFAKGSADGRPWKRLWRAHLTATARSSLPLGRRTGELARSSALGVLPRRWFRVAWWRTHFARPRLGATTLTASRRRP